MCGTLNIDNVGEEVVLNGWVAKRRNLGGLIFVDLRDKTGIVQVTFDDKIPQELFDRADSLRSEYVVGVKGKVCERSSKNTNIATGKTNDEIIKLFLDSAKDKKTQDISIIEKTLEILDFNKDGKFNSLDINILEKYNDKI